MSSCFRWIGVASTCAAVLGACAKPAPPPNQLPAPGEMRLIEAAPLALSGKDASLIPNGSFEEFYAGANLPVGPYEGPPAGAKHSVISRTADHVADGRYAVLQDWAALDWGDTVDDHFGLAVETLQPNKPYRFEFRANTLGTPGPHMAIYAIADDGNYEAVYDLPVQKSDNFRNYAVAFNLGKFTQIRIATLGPPDPKAYPSKCVWDAWRLIPVPADTPLNIGPDTFSGPLPNGGFDVWLGAAPAPEHWQAPRAELRHSEVQPVLRAADNPAIVVHQIWRAADTDDLPGDLFGGTMSTVKQATHYRLSLEANTLGEFKARVEAYGVVGTDSYVLIGGIDIPTHKGFKPYSLDFESKQYQKIVFVTRCPDPATKYPNRVAWDNWRIEEAGPAQVGVVASPAKLPAPATPETAPAPGAGTPAPAAPDTPAAAPQAAPSATTPAPENPTPAAASAAPAPAPLAPAGNINAPPAPAPLAVGVAPLPDANTASPAPSANAAPGTSAPHAQSPSTPLRAPAQSPSIPPK